MIAGHDIISPSDRPDLELIKKLFFVRRVCLLVAAVIGGVVLWAWFSPGFAALLPAVWIQMKANTALLVLLAAAALALGGEEQNPWVIRVAQLCALLMLMLATSAIYASLSGSRLWLDTMLAADAGAPVPGRMSLQTAAFFTLLGALLLPGVRDGKRWHMLSDALTVLLIAGTFVFSAAYLFGAPKVVGVSAYLRVSPHTLVCMALISFAVLVQATRAGLFAVLVGVGIGSRGVRLSLPLTLLAPVLFIRLGAGLVTAGYLPVPFAAAMTTAAVCVVLLLVMLREGTRENGLERALRDLSLTDELTGIYNRRGFLLLGQHSMLQRRRAGLSLTVLYFDLDGLKQVNDTLGHDAGSNLLRDFASVLRTSFRRSDVTARLGGDEFGVVLLCPRSEVTVALERFSMAVAHENAPAASLVPAG